MEQEHGLLFVYKADSGLFNTVTDIAHKIFSPDTYQCALCKLTHGYFEMRDEWKGFIEQLGVPTEYRHQDELEGLAGIDPQQLPAVYRWYDGGWKLCVCAVEIEACNDLAMLKRVILSSCLSKNS